MKIAREALEALIADDEFGLLTPAPKRTPATSDDPVGEVLELRNVPRVVNRPDEIAQQVPCEDFDLFEPLFKACHADLRAGRRDLVGFQHESRVDAERFYVLRGVLVYVARIGEQTYDRNNKIYARTRCIYENGTESNLLVRSLGRGLLRGGKRVTEPSTGVDFRPLADLQVTRHGKQARGQS